MAYGHLVIHIIPYGVATYNFECVFSFEHLDYNIELWFCST